MQLRAWSHRRPAGAWQAPPRSHQRQRSVVPASLAAPEAATAPLKDCKAGDIVQLGDGASPAYLEVLAPFSAASGACSAVYQGRLMRLQLSEDGSSVELTQTGVRPDPSDPAVQKFKAWAPALAKLKAVLQADCGLPARVPASSARVVGSLQQLEERVRSNASPWVDGTGPDNPAPSGLDYHLLSAGELTALLLGLRGVAMVQLHVGWDATPAGAVASSSGSGGGGEAAGGGGSGEASSSGAGALQPVLNPGVFTLLARAAASPDIAIVTSPAPGGLGLTALLSANKEPFRAWAAHLASFGAQAALVADSPYYKMLVGRVLGYKEANIVHHIRSFNGLGQPSPQVVAAVDAELSKVSAKKPSLPWNVSSRGRGAKAGGQQQQQQQQQGKGGPRG